MPDLPLPDDLDDEDESDAYWRSAQDHFHHDMVKASMGFLETFLCPDIRYTEAISEVMQTEVYPEVKRLCRDITDRLAARVDTLGDLYEVVISEGND
jgi:hypothetical protein